MSAQTPDSSATKPFYFSCHRSGNCCRVGHGRVWIEENDLATYAQLVGMSAAAFVSLHVLQVDGRLSLRERADGRCNLLDEQNSCSIYSQRPEQCRTFPYWPEILASPKALQRAARTCPGIQRFPDPQTCQRVLPQVATLLDSLLQRQRLDSAASPSATDLRWSNALEVDLFLATGINRHIYVAELLTELGLELQQLAEASGYPWSSAAWPRLLADRRHGWLERGGFPSLP